MELFPTNVHGERTRDEAPGMSEWEARNRLYQYMGRKNLVSTLNMGSSYCSHSSLLVTPYSDPKCHDKRTCSIHRWIANTRAISSRWHRLPIWLIHFEFLAWQKCVSHFSFNRSGWYILLFLVLKKSERFTRDHVLRSPFAFTARSTISGEKPSWMHVGVV